ncbi:transcriptional regulator [Nocardia sp. SYP-A9097]|uniref:transcriptional regulator n=1 Tax=Nocardia sp. SYP-A9097 TaxID=2663237 RepID=UPI00132A9FFB|nr:transcriptional regulator [Nocardia sp. SYP-A9097]MRH93223.1 transcriptional regulator [Nocardia sp. SYP-A9097]
MSAAPHRRPALIVFVVVAFVACLGLGWWQWGRYESGSGTGQNLGYALQWPLFAGFVVWAYLRFVRLEKDAQSEATPAPADAGSAARPKRPKPVAPREIPAGLLPERPKAAASDDPQTTEYNRYLAALHASDLDQQIQHAGLRNHPERSAG